MKLIGKGGLFKSVFKKNEMQTVNTEYCVAVKNIIKIEEKEYEQLTLYDYLFSLKGVTTTTYSSYRGNAVYFTIDYAYDNYALKKRIKQIIKSYENFNYKIWGNKGWK